MTTLTTVAPLKPISALKLDCWTLNSLGFLRFTCWLGSSPEPVFGPHYTNSFRGALGLLVISERWPQANTPCVLDA